MPSYILTEHNGADMPARFYVDGIRVSRERFESIRAAAYAAGTLDSFHTSGRQLGGGRIRRVNRSRAVTP